MFLHPKLFIEVLREPDVLIFISVSQRFCFISPQVPQSANIYHLPLGKGGHTNPGLPFRKCLPSLSSMPSGLIGGRWKGGPRGGKGSGILNLSGGNMGPPGIICGGMCGMFGGGRNGGRWGFGIPGGCCRGGMPGLGPCMTPGPGSIPGAVGDPSWLSVHASEGVPLSAAESFVSSRGCKLPAAKEHMIRLVGNDIIRGKVLSNIQPKTVKKLQQRSVHIIMSKVTLNQHFCTLIVLPLFHSVYMSHLVPALYGQTPGGWKELLLEAWM